MITRCKLCLMPDTRPDTPFVDGVCQACLNHDKVHAVDWDARKGELIKLLQAQDHVYKATGFDCIVASSGGKDSHSQVLNLIELGAKPLVVTATTCMLTKIGRRNIDNLKLYAPTIEISPDVNVRAKLNKLGLQLVGDISWPEHVAIFTIPLRLSIAMGIPLVFYGENPQAQYGGPPGTEEAKLMTRRWVSEFGGFLGLRPSDMVGMDDITEADMAMYKFPTDGELELAGSQVHFLGQYLGPWDSHANAEKAQQAGMATALPFWGNWWTHENLDNAMTGIHDLFMFRKYGYSRACTQLSVDIRNGRISREYALSELYKLEGYFPEAYMGVRLDTVLKYIGMSRAEFDMLLFKFTNYRLTTDDYVS